MRRVDALTARITPRVWRPWRRRATLAPAAYAAKATVNSARNRLGARARFGTPARAQHAVIRTSPHPARTGRGRGSIAADRPWVIRVAPPPAPAMVSTFVARGGLTCSPRSPCASLTAGADVGGRRRHRRRSEHGEIPVGRSEHEEVDLTIADCGQLAAKEGGWGAVVSRGLVIVDDGHAPTWSERSLEAMEELIALGDLVVHVGQDHHVPALVGQSRICRDAMDQRDTRDPLPSQPRGKLVEIALLDVLGIDRGVRAQAFGQADCVVPVARADVGHAHPGLDTEAVQ